MRGKIFTVDEANRMLPLVGRIADDIVTTYTEVNQALAAYETSKARNDSTASADADLKRPLKALPQVTLQEMIVAFRDVVSRSEMFAHHHVKRERLSVRARMADILATLERASFVEFGHLFRAEEGRMGVTVTFMAILELVREGLLDIVQAEVYGPLHVRSAGPNRALHLVASNDLVAGDPVESDQREEEQPPFSAPAQDDDLDDDPEDEEP